jgi:hypothetical protein
LLSVPVPDDFAHICIDRVAFAGLVVALSDALIDTAADAKRA